MTLKIKTSVEPTIVCPICNMPVDKFYGSFDSGYKCFVHGKVEPVNELPYLLDKSINNPTAEIEWREEE